MSQDPNDAIVCLRLELHRVSDQLETVRQVLEFERKENLRLRNEREVLILEVKQLRHERVHDLNAIGGEQEENARLKAEVERLRKAGDYLADHLAHEFGTCPSIEIWNAAKEGKQP